MYLFLLSEGYKKKKYMGFGDGGYCRKKLLIFYEIIYRSGLDLSIY